MRSVPNLKPWLTFAPCPIPLRQNNGICPGNPNTKDPTIAQMTPSAQHITSNVCSDVCYLSNQSQVLMDRGRGDWPVVTLFHPCSPLSVHLQHTISPVFGQLVRACVCACVSALICGCSRAHQSFIGQLWCHISAHSRCTHWPDSRAHCHSNNDHNVWHACDATCSEKAANCVVTMTKKCAFFLSFPLLWILTVIPYSFCFIDHIISSFI